MMSIEAALRAVHAARWLRVPQLPDWHSMNARRHSSGVAVDATLTRGREPGQTSEIIEPVGI